MNCGAIPDGLFEAEMFGAERGAYTGATEARVGFYLRAHRGTLFLDEVAELTPPAQTKLLRVIESGRVIRLGAKRDEPADVRLIAASHRRLRDAVKEGTFREDLCFRLSVVELNILPAQALRATSRCSRTCSPHALPPATESTNPVSRPPRSRRSGATRGPETSGSCATRWSKRWSLARRSRSTAGTSASACVARAAPLDQSPPQRRTVCASVSRASTARKEPIPQALAEHRRQRRARAGAAASASRA